MEQTYIKDNAIRRRISDFALSKQLKLRLGKVLATVQPQRARKVASAPFRPDMGAFDRLIRNGLQARALEERDDEVLRRYLSHYWGQEAKNFHESWQDRFERMFLKHDVVVIDELEKVMAADGGLAFENLYEIGCGGGQVLQHLCNRLGGIGAFVGVDLGKEQIDQNRKAYDNGAKMSFHAADAVEWIPANAKPNSVFLTNGGVFEYFLREELLGLFRHIATRCAPAAVALVETIGSDHDLQTSTVSYVYGRELSFSHNYPALLKEAGFDIVHQSERAGYEVDGGGRWIRMLATKLEAVS